MSSNVNCFVVQQMLCEQLFELEIQSAKLAPKPLFWVPEKVNAHAVRATGWFSLSSLPLHPQPCGGLHAEAALPAFFSLTLTAHIGKFFPFAAGNSWWNIGDLQGTQTTHRQTQTVCCVLRVHLFALGVFILHAVIPLQPCCQGCLCRRIGCLL